LQVLRCREPFVHFELQYRIPFDDLWKSAREQTGLAAAAGAEHQTCREAPALPGIVCLTEAVDLGFAAYEEARILYWRELEELMVEGGTACDSPGDVERAKLGPDGYRRRQFALGLVPADVDQ